jgi:hypothetical protein
MKINAGNNPYSQSDEKTTSEAICYKRRPFIREAAVDPFTPIKTNDSAKKVSTVAQKALKETHNI